jgi:hypothetical protein
MNMQMIDVLKRLAELDAKNPNIVKESTRPMDIEECGDDMMSAEPSQSNSPVSVNISANSGEELGDMLSAIMQLAGVHKVGDEHMGVEPPASVLTAEPNMHKDAHGVDDMRAVLDQMNGASGEEETDESAASDETHPHGIPGVDTTPADPHKQLPFDPNEFSQNTNDGDGNDENGHPRLTTQPTATYESLMAEYKKFVTESTLKESSYEDILKHFPKQVQDFKNGGELDYDLESALWDYHFNNGDIRNYDADASEYIGQNLADYLGVDENMERESVEVSEISTALVNKVHNARELNRDIAGAADAKDHSARIQAKADSMGKSKWDRSVTVEPGQYAAAADAAQQKFDRNKQLTAKRSNSNYGQDQAELRARNQQVGIKMGSK